MKTKNKVTFEENRLLGKTPKDKAEVTSEAAESPTDKALKFISKINEYQAIEGGDNPASILENNPYKDALTAFAEDLDAKAYEFTDVEYKPGQLILKYPKGPLAIEKDLFAAIFWKEIAKKLEAIFKGKNVSPELMALAVQQNSPKFDILVFEVAKGGKAPIAKGVIGEAIAELELLRPKLNIEGAKKRVQAKGEMERELVKKTLPKLPEVAPLNKETFLKRFETRKDRDELDRLKLNINREEGQINVQKWDYTNLAGLTKIYQDCRDLEIPVHNDFYQSMFAILRNGADPTKNPYKSNPAYEKLFLNPANHLIEIESLPADGTFWGGEQYAKAFEHLHYLQGILLVQDKLQVDTLKKQGDLDSDPVATKVTDFVRDNVSKFQKAIKERDYATAGLYAVGIFAIYKSIQKLSGGGGGHGAGNGNMMKWLAYGAAIYAGNTFLKNAGYDILKMTGFRDKDYEVKGTPMEVMQNILNNNPVLRDTTKDLDYGLVLRMSEVKLTSLQELYEKSNKNGVQFIHPYEFPDILPEEAKTWPFDMGIGEKGLSEYTGMSNTKLSPSQREYIRVGQQLYKMAAAMKGIYESTLMLDHTAYKGLTYEQAIAGDSTRKLGKVRHLLDAVSPYARRTFEGRLSKKKVQEVETEIREIFKGQQDSGIWLENKIGAGHYSGWINGFPVVFVAEENGYRVYLRNKYGNLNQPGKDFITIVPAEGPDRERKAKDVVNAVKNRILELLQPLENAAGKKLDASTLIYKDGKWSCEVTLPGAAEFGVNAVTENAELTPFVDGTGISLTVKNGVRINVDENVGKQFSAALGLLPNIVSQPEFNALRVLNNGRKLNIEDSSPGDKKLNLLIGKRRIKLELQYDGASKKFAIANPAEEKGLVQSSGFAQEYIEALDSDEQFELNKTLGQLKDLISKSAPEGFVAYFFKALAQDTKQSPLDGINLDLISGSIPEYFSNMILDTSKKEVFQRLRRRILAAETLEDVEQARKEVLEDFNARMQGLSSQLAAENARLAKEGKKWDRDEFMARVVDQIRSASSVSSTYSLARADFEYMAYSLSLPGLLKKSDLSQLSHKVAGDLMAVFIFYTAHLDNHNFNGVDIDLDHLTYPPAPTAGIDAKVDPALRGHYILSYLEYVKNATYNKAAAKDDLSNIPDPTAKRFWEIKEFEEWLQTEGDYKPLDPLDAQPAFDHDVTLHTSGQHTELDKEMAKEYDRAVAFLRNEYGTILNHKAIDDYLRQAYINPTTGQKVPYGEIGILHVFDYPTPGNPTCKLWDKTNRIDSISKASGNKRSTQTRLIQQEVEESIRFIFANPDRFFNKTPSITSRLVRRWPWLRHLPGF